jgi:hypothetical protein
MAWKGVRTVGGKSVPCRINRRRTSRSAAENGAFCYLVKGCPPRMIHEVVLKAWAHDRA